MDKVIGQTMDVGFQFGIRKTFSISAAKVWDYLVEEHGLAIWLGKCSTDLELNDVIKTDAGVSARVRVFKPNSHIRMSWKKQAWSNTSTLQLRVIDKGAKTVISIHQEKLLDAAQRLEMKQYWGEVMQKLTKAIDSTLTL